MIPCAAPRAGHGLDWLYTGGMTADEIRKVETGDEYVGNGPDKDFAELLRGQFLMLREIAAQLAEQNEKNTKLEKLQKLVDSLGLGLL